MRSGASVAVSLLLFAALLLFVQILVPNMKGQVGQSEVHCCPECNDDGDNKTHQAGESCCSYTPGVALYVMHVGTLSMPPPNKLAHRFETMLNPQLPGHYIFHPPIAA